MLASLPPLTATLLAQVAGAALALWFAYVVAKALLAQSIPRVVVAAPADVAEALLEHAEAGSSSRKRVDPDARLADRVPCWDPSTLMDLGTLPVTTPDEVGEVVARGRVAQQAWAGSSFDQRRLLLRTMQRFIVENQETIARVAVIDSGKTMTDAAFGEVLVTCEKLKWMAQQGEK